MSFHHIHPDLAKRKTSRLSKFVAYLLFFLIIASVVSSILAYVWPSASFNYLPLATLFLIFIVFAYMFSLRKDSTYATFIYRKIPPEKLRVKIELLNSDERGFFETDSTHHYIASVPNMTHSQYECSLITNCGAPLDLNAPGPLFSDEELDMKVFIDPVNQMAIVGETEDGYRFWLKPRVVAVGKEAKN